MLRLLITNDDGVDAPGLKALASRLGPRAEVTVLAPDSPRSASSHSITLHKPLRLTARPDLQQQLGCHRVISSSGTPADCVTLALDTCFAGQPPHFVLSGVNDGPNLSEDLIYSGTVAGAVEAAVHGIPAMAISLSGTEQGSFALAAEITELVMCSLLYGGYPPWSSILTGQTSLELPHPRCWKLQAADRMEQHSSTLDTPGEWWPADMQRCPCFNMNIPDLDEAQIRGICWAALGHREYRNVVVEQEDPKGRSLYWIWGDRIVPEQHADSDILALNQGLVAVTPIQGDLLNRGDLLACYRLFSATQSEKAES